MFFNQKENVKKALKKFKILFLYDPYSSSWIYCWFYLYLSYKPTPEQPKYKIFSSYLERFVEQFYSHARTHACTMYIRMCIHIMYDLFRNPALPRFVFFFIVIELLDRRRSKLGITILANVPSVACGISKISKSFFAYVPPPGYPRVS